MLEQDGALPSLLLDGKTVEYGESLASFEKKFPYWKTSEMDDYVLRTDLPAEYAESFVYAKADKQFGNDKLIRYWGTKLEGAGTQELKVGDSYRKIMESNPAYRIYLNRDPRNCLYIVKLNAYGQQVSWEDYYEYSGDEMTEDELHEKYDREYSYELRIRVENGIIIMISFGDSDALGVMSIALCIS